MTNDSLGDRIKRYEAAFRHRLVQRMPCIIRVDGRAFHTITRHMQRPFDENFMTCMEVAAVATAREMQGFKAAYVQSDEATFAITDYDTLRTSGWFDYDLNKMVSLTAAIMSAQFLNAMHGQAKYLPSLAVFDARAFSVPVDDVVNVFLWRAKDWERNSIQMYAHSLFSHKQLHKKNISAMHEMLHSVGKNWATDLSDRERNGVFLIRRPGGAIERRTDILPTFPSINAAIGGLFTFDADTQASAPDTL